MGSRFPLKEVEEACGLESGDWATMTTKLDGDKLCFALAHRRGGCVRNCPSAPLARSPAHADICVVCACIDSYLYFDAWDYKARPRPSS